MKRSVSKVAVMFQRNSRGIMFSEDPPNTLLEANMRCCLIGAYS